MVPEIEFVKKYTAKEILNKNKKNLDDSIINEYIDSVEHSDVNHLDVVHKCEISLINIQLSLVNSLRRIMISYIPIVALGKINIEKNNTSLINEFIEKRLQLLSLTMQEQNKFGDNYNIRTDTILNSLRLKSSYNKNTGTREYNFIEDAGDIEFSLNKANNIEIEYIKSINIINNNNNKYFRKDSFSNEYDIITKLKENEELSINMGLDCGIGFNNTIYSPVGTVSVKPVYINNIEDIKIMLEKAKSKDPNLNTEKLIKSLENEKILYIQSYESYKNNIINEKLEKGLITEEEKENPFDDDELDNIKHDFDTLIRPRIYPDNINGDSTSYIINIETNNNLKCEQIFIDALSVLYISIQDLISNIKLNYKPVSYKENLCTKLILEQIDSNKYKLFIENENNTIGNLLFNYLDNYNNTLSEEKLEFISYSQPHPLINNILFKFDTELGDKHILKIIKNVLQLIQEDIKTIGEQYLEILKSKFNYDTIELNEYPDYLKIPDFISYTSFLLEI